MESKMGAKIGIDTGGGEPDRTLVRNDQLRELVLDFNIYARLRKP